MNMTWWTRAVDWVSSVFGSLFHNLIKETEHQLAELPREQFEIAKQLAADRVAASASIGNDEPDILKRADLKFNAARDGLWADLAAKEIALGLHVVYALVVAAVSDLHAEQAVAAPPPPVAEVPTPAATAETPAAEPAIEASTGA